MNKLTHGKWEWKLNADTIDFYVDGKPLHPTLADAELICSALEMYKKLQLIVDYGIEKERAIEVEDYTALRKAVVNQQEAIFLAQKVIERIQRKEH